MESNNITEKLIDIPCLSSPFCVVLIKLKEIYYICCDEIKHALLTHTRLNIDIYTHIDVS